MGAAIIAGEITRAAKKYEKNEVKREIMTCLSKIFSLTKDNLTMDREFTSKIGY